MSSDEVTVVTVALKTPDEVASSAKARAQQGSIDHASQHQVKASDLVTDAPFPRSGTAWRVAGVIMHARVRQCQSLRGPGFKSLDLSMSHSHAREAFERAHEIKQSAHAVRLSRRAPVGE